MYKKIIYTRINYSKQVKNMSDNLKEKVNAI